MHAWSHFVENSLLFNLVIKYLHFCMSLVTATIKDKQRNIISFLSSTRKMATWQFTNRPLLIKLYRVIVFVQISMKFFFPWKAFLMYYNPSNKFFTHLYHNSRHNCLKKCSVFFCAMVNSPLTSTTFLQLVTKMVITPLTMILDSNDSFIVE